MFLSSARQSAVKTCHTQHINLSWWGQLNHLCHQAAGSHRLRTATGRDNRTNDPATTAAEYSSDHQAQPSASSLLCGIGAALGVALTGHWHAAHAQQENVLPTTPAAQPTPSTPTTAAATLSAAKPSLATLAAASSASPTTLFQEGSDFVVYRNTGVAVLLAELVGRLVQYDVVLLGESHDDPVAHHLELQILLGAVQAVRGSTAETPPTSTSRPLAPSTTSHSTVSNAQDGPFSNSMNLRTATASTSQPSMPPATSNADSAAGTAGDGASPMPPSLDPSHAAASTASNNHSRPAVSPTQAARRVVLSLEMFDRDVQLIMDEYLSGAIRESDLLRDARPWPNYECDYRPLVLAAKTHGLPVVCANAPRRYVSLAGRHGAAALLKLLPSAGLRHLPPLPYAPASPAYVVKIQRTMSPRPAQSTVTSSTAGLVALAPPAVQSDRTMMATTSSTAASVSSSSSSSSGGSVGASGMTQPHVESTACPYIGLSVSSNFIDAQSLWDASMAAAIAEALGAQGCHQTHQSPLVSASPQQLSINTAAQPVHPNSVRSCSGGSPISAPRGNAAASQVPSLSHTEPPTNVPSALSASPPPALSAVLLAAPPLVVHVCGKFHSEHGLGIVERLKVLAPSARVLCVSFEPVVPVTHASPSSTGGTDGPPTDRRNSRSSRIDDNDNGSSSSNDSSSSSNDSSSSSSSSSSSRGTSSSDETSAVHLSAEAFRAAGHQYAAHYVVLTDGRRPRSFDNLHPV